MPERNTSLNSVRENNRSPVAIGIEVDEKAVREASVNGHRFRGPEWHHRDGSFAEW